MASSEELKNQIVEATRNLAASELRYEQLGVEKLAALERQQLRKALKAVRRDVHLQETCNRTRERIIADIDADNDVDMPHNSSKSGEAATSLKFVSSEATTSCDSKVMKGEFVWTIEGMSWMKHTLEQSEDNCVIAPNNTYFKIGSQEFDFRYAPDGFCSHDKQGSLVIVHHFFEESISIRYKILIRRATGEREFVLWGEGSECVTEKYPLEPGLQIFGPDAHSISDDRRPSGVFGLNHDQLLSSEWIYRDTLTVKFELEIQTNAEAEQLKEVQVDIPPSSLSVDLLSLLEEGTCSDVDFIIQGQRIKAHSPILCARSEYFQKAFSNGLRESISKEVVVEDCDVESFKALLSFLYSDDFSQIEAMLRTVSERKTESQSDVHSSFILKVLELSHKYQICRLQAWCEHKLGMCLSINSVCAVLRQAHLFGASWLEKECYKFIKSNLLAVMATPAYVTVVKEWPEVAVKISVFSLGLPESSASTLIETQLKTLQAAGSKRKREE